MDDFMIDTENVELDTLVKMIKMSFSLELWNKLNELADSLYRRTLSIYNNFLMNPNLIFQLERPLVYYYGYALLIKGLAMEKLRKYEDARQYINLYSDLSWFEGLDRQGHEVVEKYKFYAQANLLCIDLLSGNTSVLDDYILFLQENPQEMLAGMNTILEAADIHQMNIEHVMRLFPNQILNHTQYNPQEFVNNAYFHAFLDKLIRYVIHHVTFSGAADYLLKILSLLEKIPNDKIFKKTVAAFEIIREHAAAEQIQQYRSLLYVYLERELRLEQPGHLSRYAYDLH